MKRILVAGIGNIFLGDDAFGVEVVREFEGRTLPGEVQVKDFGIRGYDLAFELAGGASGNGYEAVILVDATPRGESPGTVYLIEPDLADLGRPDQASADGHDMGPVRVLQMAEALGGQPARLFFVGCEPGELESPDGRIGLSDVVRAAVPKAVEMIESLVKELMQQKLVKTGVPV